MLITDSSQPSSRLNATEAKTPQRFRAPGSALRSAGQLDVNLSLRKAVVEAEA